MSSNYRLGQWAGLAISAEPSVVPATAVLGAVATLVAGRHDVRGLGALGVGLAVAALHWAGDLGHQIGHATAARQTGYPMDGGARLGAAKFGDLPPG